MIKWSAITKWYSISFSNYWGSLLTPKCKVLLDVPTFVVKTANAVYVFEFKLNGTAEEALAQIDNRGYLIPYTAYGCRMVEIGAEFSKEERNL